MNAPGPTLALLLTTAFGFFCSSAPDRVNPVGPQTNFPAGTYAVTHGDCPGICAMDRSQIDSWVGRKLEVHGTRLRLHHGPDCQIRSTTRRGPDEYGDIAGFPAALAPRGSLLIVEFSCAGESDSVARLDDGRVAYFIDGVVFYFKKVR